MKQTLLLHLAIQVPVSLIVGITYVLGTLIGNGFANVLYILELLIVLFLYFYLGDKFLKDISKQELMYSVVILFLFNLLLGFSKYDSFGYLMFFNNIFVAPLFLLEYYPIGIASDLKFDLIILLLSLMSPLLILLGSRKYIFVKK